MLKVKNQDIWVTRGETCALTFTGIKKNGEPYILTPKKSGSSSLRERTDYAVLALTIRTSAYGDIVLEKYMDLEAEPMYGGTTDYTPGGFHKFTTQRIFEIANISDAYTPGYVYKFEGTYITVIKDYNNKMGLKPYQFKLQIPFLWTELEKLEPKEYVYDISLYYGQLTSEQVDAIENDTEAPSGFPLILDRNLIKIPLISIHKFIVEDSNNV